MKNKFFTIGAVAAATLISSAFAQDYSTASAISNHGAIVGGSLRDDFSGFNAFILNNGVCDELATLGGFASRADAINEHGQAVGQADTADFDSNGEAISIAFLADADGLRALAPLPGFNHSQAYGINNRGTAVGWSYNQHPFIPGAVLGNFQATVWSDGEASVLGHLGGGNSVALSVNDAGTIVGRSRLPDGRIHAFIHEKGEMKSLGTLGGPRSEARAINNRGQVVGQSFLANNQRHAVLWEDGEAQDLGTLGGTYSRAWAINDHGVVVGESTTADGEWHAFAYDGEMHDLGTLGGTYSVALGINSVGEIVGESETVTGDIHAFVIRNGIMIDLDADLPQ